MSNDRAEKHREIADQKTPPHIKSLVHYIHSLTEIWEYYRALGNNPPEAFMAEMCRAEDEIIQTLESETSQGGALHAYYHPKKESK